MDLPKYMIPFKLVCPRNRFGKMLLYMPVIYNNEWPSLFYSADVVLTMADLMVQLGIDTKDSQSDRFLSEDR